MEERKAQMLQGTSPTKQAVHLPQLLPGHPPLWRVATTSTRFPLTITSSILLQNIFVFIFILCFSFFYSFVTPSQSYPLSSAHHLIHHQHYITIAIPTQPICSPSIHYYYHTTIHHHTHHNHSSLAPPPFTTTIITHTTTITDEVLITSLQLLIETLQLRLEIYCLERNSEFIIKRLINENFSVLIVDWSLNGVTSGAVYKDFVSFDLNGGFSGGGEMEQVHQMVSYRCHGFYPSILLHPWILTYLLHASNYTYTYT